jgi:para-nitrobenzyl esterase
VASRAAHCIDVSFLFDCLHAEGVGVLMGEAPPQQLATDIHDAAVKSITAGDPGWPEYAAPHYPVHLYDLPTADLDGGYSDLDLITPQRVV